jgi:signal transduction histidine kinase
MPGACHLPSRGEEVSSDPQRDTSARPPADSIEELRASHRRLEALTGELRENQAQLVQSEKMAAIGHLAAGVAHEINNPVGYVTSNLGTLREYVAVFKELVAEYGRADSALRGGDRSGALAALDRVAAIRREQDLDFILEDVDQLLDDSAEGTRRVAEIVQGLKGFARSDEQQVREASVNDCLEATLKVVWNELKYKCSVEKRLGPVPAISCYPGKLNQVFMNLLVNAAQAIPGRGEVTVESGTEGDQVFVRVSDTGEGIPAERLERIFEPFFTTKQPGRGTGLGLAISRSIVEEHGGRLEVASREGRGTAFTVRLPVEGLRRG